ncbi:MAG: response regulator [Deltaproteobacteria bacterium]|nr:response regulator [Deltaproteobacteria bacterium]
MTDDSAPIKVIRILLVEDSPSVALQIQTMLSNSNNPIFEVDHETTLEAALERITDEGIDLVILDLGLPDSEGMETFTRMQERAVDAAMVVFTGVDDQELAFEALRLGAQDYLVKGKVDGALLIRAIRYAMERKQAEISLRASEEKHRTLLEAMPDIVYKIDSEGTFKFVNEAVISLGYTPEELIGCHFSVLIHPDDIENVSRSSVLPRLAGSVTGDVAAPKLLDERRTRERMTRDLTLRLIPKSWTREADTADNGVLFGSLTSYGEVTAVGHYALNRRTQVTRFAGTVGIIKDISERKRAAEEKLALEMQLQQSQKMEAIGRLAGGVAHDMNNVLGAIMGSASALEFESLANDEQRADLENILVACRKGRDLTRDLLGFARKGKYIKEPIFLNEIVGEVKSLLARTIQKTIHVRTELSPAISYIAGDRSQMHHALMNVCINGVDAIVGSGELLISTQNISVADGAFASSKGIRPGEYVQLTVTDTGVGIHDDIIDKVFEPFFTTKPKGEGTGLGLSMAYGVVQNHGGSLSLSSSAEGTTVVFLLPAVPDAEVQIPEKTKPRISSYPRKGAILLIDDEMIIRNAAKRLLHQMGHDVILAENGRQGIETFRARKQEISLVLLDIIMPDIDGIDTWERLVEIEPTVNVVLFSGYSKDERVEKLLESGAVQFVQKPFDVEVLASTIRRALQSS